MAVMASPPSTPLCFVLPRRGESARLAALILALERFVATQNEAARSYAESMFKVGDLVRIHPGKHVFRFGGFEDGSSEHMWFQPLKGSVRDRWRVKASDFVARLERTTLTRPIGRLNTPIYRPEPAAIDRLLGTSTFGNKSLFRNEVVLLDSASGFREFVESSSLRSIREDGGSGVLKDLLPFGDVSPPSHSRPVWLKKWDERNPTGEPLLAITHSAEELARFCIDAPASSKLVVVNGLSRVKDLQSYDDMSQTQQVILFADAKDEGMIDVLRQRGCGFWFVTLAEVQAGCHGPSRSDGIIGRIRIWTSNRENLKLDVEQCDDTDLDDLWSRLHALRHEVDRDEANAITKLMRRAWGLLIFSSSLVRAPTEEERDRVLSELKILQQELRMYASWLTPGAARVLSEAGSRIEVVIMSRMDLGKSKADALDRAVRESIQARLKCVLLVRSQKQASELENMLRSRGYAGRLSVQPHLTFTGEAGFDRLILVSWLGAAAMTDVVEKLAAPRITLLGYSFERRWLTQWTQRADGYSSSPRMMPAEKARLIGCGDAQSWPSAPATEVPEASEPQARSDEDIHRFEERLRSARKGTASIPSEAPDSIPSYYVSFVGECYAFLTETHRIVVVSDLVSGNFRQQQRLPERTISQLKQGDFVVFPESGAKELIREKADQLLGTEAPRLRKAARLWKEALWACGIGHEEFLREARDLGRPRHPMTIRHWFAETSQIGPGLGNEDLSEDLELIALVTDYTPLKQGIQETIAAIKELRSAHLSAGMRIRDALIRRLPEVVGRVTDAGSMVDLGELGAAWIVQIEWIGMTSEPRGHGEVNRLLREDEQHRLRLVL